MSQPARIIGSMLTVVADPSMPENEIALVDPGEKQQIITPRGEVIGERWIRKPQVVRVTNLKTEENPDAQK